MLGFNRAFYRLASKSKTSGRFFKVIVSLIRYLLKASKIKLVLFVSALMVLNNVHSFLLVYLIVKFLPSSLKFLTISKKPAVVGVVGVLT
jgi:hypothetical protein